ncbi:hypothetical protein J6590_037487 [Homalodisca vitripennis]|nr:hypothetical protein J6590_037487 [Homalodisca vitripennis]
MESDRILWMGEVKSRGRLLSRSMTKNPKDINLSHVSLEEGDASSCLSSQSRKGWHALMSSKNL